MLNVMALGGGCRPSICVAEKESQWTCTVGVSCPCGTGARLSILATSVNDPKHDPPLSSPVWPNECRTFEEEGEGG